MALSVVPCVVPSSRDGRVTCYETVERYETVSGNHLADWVSDGGEIRLHAFLQDPVM